jgi:hypothetical protein
MGTGYKTKIDITVDAVADISHNVVIRAWKSF